MSEKAAFAGQVERWPSGKEDFEERTPVGKEEAVVHVTNMPLVSLSFLSKGYSSCGLTKIMRVLDPDI